MGSTSPHEERGWLKDYFGRAFRENWNLLSLVTGLIVTAIGRFLDPPPADTNFGAFLKFLVILFLAIGVYFLHQWRRASDATLWLVVTLVSWVAVFASVMVYFSLESSWTVPYSGHRVVIGSSYTQTGQAFVSKHPDMALEDVVMHFAGDTERIWTRESLNTRRTSLGMLYLLCGMLSTTAMAAAVQLVYCRSLSPEPRGG